MNAEQKKAYLDRLNLNQDKINKMIERAIKACFAYEKGEMTMKQVWHRARGDRFSVACLNYPDKDLGFCLYALACDFYTSLGVYDAMIHNAIFSVIAAAKHGQEISRSH